MKFKPTSFNTAFKFLLFINLVLIVSTGVVIIMGFYYEGRVLPRSRVLGNAIQGDDSDAAATLQSLFPTPEYFEFYLNEQSIKITPQDIEFNYNYIETINQLTDCDNCNVFNLGIRAIASMVSPTKGKLLVSYNKNLLEERVLLQIVDEITEASEPQFTLTDGVVTTFLGTKGASLNETKLNDNFEENTSQYQHVKIEIPIDIIDATISQEIANLAIPRAEHFIGKSVALELDNFNYLITEDVLVKFVNPNGGYYTSKIYEEVQSVSTQVDSPYQNPIFIYNDNKVKEFLPAKDGIKMDTQLLVKLIENSLGETFIDNKLTIAIPINITPPEYSTADVNNLGIRELLGRGYSTYYGSIPSRVFNVNLAASHFNGVLVKPGETFSFNNTLGDVSSYTGYKQAYIISGGRTVLGDGGGVCQVSTTLFRAVLDAGLPVMERRAHSYRVGYYEQTSDVGLDATVYSPTTDFKFKNDTPGHLLIQTISNTTTKELIFEIYGTNDGRIATLTKPVVSGVIPPPEDLYIDDPTLPSGEVKQIDWKAWGAKVSFDYVVTKEGEIIYEESFYSNYRPWQSVFLRGTAPI